MAPPVHRTRLSCPPLHHGKTWTADFYENGRSGRRIRKKGFATKSAAIRYEQDFFAVKGET
ncbi:hypothetical protein AAIG84_33695, partial [Pseudomonas aeruginosa]